MMWLTQYIASLAEAANMSVDALTWMPTQDGVNFAFALLCFTAAIFDTCPRWVMTLSALLYLLMCTI